MVSIRALGRSVTSGGRVSNLVGIICPPWIGIWLIDLKICGGQLAPCPTDSYGPKHAAHANRSVRNRQTWLICRKNAGRNSFDTEKCVVLCKKKEKKMIDLCHNISLTNVSYRVIWLNWKERPFLLSTTLFFDRYSTCHFPLKYLKTLKVSMGSCKSVT